MRTIVEPRNSIKEGKDSITGKRLVHYSKTEKRWKPNQNIPKIRIGDEQKVENYNLAKSENFIGWELHHRLELTLDGDRACSAIELINHGMYYHRPYFELIWLTKKDHTAIHSKAERLANPLIGDKNGRYGKGYVIAGDKNGRWKGDNCSLQTKYKRAYRDFKDGIIPEDEYRKALNEYMKERRGKK